jgi:hypothetical protein
MALFTFELPHRELVHVANIVCKHNWLIYRFGLIVCQIYHLIRDQSITRKGINSNMQNTAAGS